MPEVMTFPFFLKSFYSNVLSRFSFCYMAHSFSLQCATSDPDGLKRALVIGGGIANFTDVAATFNGIIRALKEKVSISGRGLFLSEVSLGSRNV